MGKIVIPARIPDKVIFTPEEYNAFKNGLAAYLNNGEIGNVNFNVNDKIDSVKVDFSGAPSHGSTHEPGGVDEIGDIDILNTGTLASVHGSRHADLGADPLGATSVTAAMLQDEVGGELTILRRKNAESKISAELNNTFNPRPVERLDLTTATSNLETRAAHRNGKIYWAESTGTIFVYNTDPLSEGTHITPAGSPSMRDLVRVGDKLYVIDNTALKILEIDNLDGTPTVTVLVNLNDGSGAEYDSTITDARWLTRNHDGTILFCAGADNISGNYETIIRINVSTKTVTHRLKKADNTLTAGQIYFTKSRNGTEKLVFMSHTNSGTASVNRLEAADLALDDQQPVTGLTQINSQHALFDGMNMVLVSSGPGAQAEFVYVIDIMSGDFGSGGGFSQTVSRFNRLGFAAGDDIEPFGIAFNGRYFMFPIQDTAGPMEILCIPYNNYAQQFIFQPSPEGTTELGSIAYDAKHVYIWEKQIGVGNGRITKWLL